MRAVLVDSGIFPAELADQEQFLTDCVALAEICRRGGVRAAISAALQQVSSERLGTNHD